MKFVLDASAVLSGKDFPATFEYYTTPSVVDEIKPGRFRRKLEYLMSVGLNIAKPSKKSINLIKEKATETGDLGRVSSTDIELLALTLELDGVMLTDDYSIQNLAKELGIRYEPIVQKGIKEKFVWCYRCIGCGKYFDEFFKYCPVCGSRVKTIKK